MSDEKSKLVYSTDKGISRKEKPAEKDLRKINTASVQKVYVYIERKGRGGKTVTLIEGIQLPEKEREKLLKQLKTKLGTGGVLKDERLEIQGDHRNAILVLLQGMGYKPKSIGG